MPSAPAAAGGSWGSRAHGGGEGAGNPPASCPRLWGQNLLRAEPQTGPPATPKQRHMAWPKVLCSLPPMLLSPVESQGRPAPRSGGCGHPLTLFSSDLWRTNPFLCWGEVLTLCPAMLAATSACLAAGWAVPCPLPTAGVYPSTNRSLGATTHGLQERNVIVGCPATVGALKAGELESPHCHRPEYLPLV